MARIPKNEPILGQEIFDSYIIMRKALKEGLAMGMAWNADDLISIEPIINQLPELLDSLTRKGAVVEQQLASEEKPESEPPRSGR